MPGLQFLDFNYLVFMAPAILLSLAASIYTQVIFKRYSKQRAVSGMTGAEAAQRLLKNAGVNDVDIEPVEGFLSDHYDPSSRTLRLSPAVYNSDSLAAIGVACHEAGHALQHASGYAPLHIRSILVPAAQFGPMLSWIVIAIGFAISSLALVKLGIFVFGLMVLFSIVTLPVEWNATSRAKKLMVSTGMVTVEEQSAAARVLNAAFMTYVAAAFSALMTLLYYLLRLGLLGGRSDD